LATSNFPAPAAGLSRTRPWIVFCVSDRPQRRPASVRDRDPSFFVTSPTNPQLAPSGSSTPAAHKLSERAEREMVGFRAGMTHRWWMAGGLIVALAIPVVMGIFEVGLGVLAAVLATSSALNGLLLYATSRPENWRAEYRYIIPLLDVGTIALIQFAFGNYGLVAVYMFAVTAYTLLVDAALGYYATALSVAGFGLAGWAHIAARVQP